MISGLSPSENKILQIFSIVGFSFNSNEFQDPLVKAENENLVPPSTVATPNESEHLRNPNLNFVSDLSLEHPQVKMDQTNPNSGHNGPVEPPSQIKVRLEQ